MRKGPGSTEGREGGSCRRGIALQPPERRPVHPEGLQPTGGTHAGAEEKRRREGASERSSHELSRAPVPGATQRGQRRWVMQENTVKTLKLYRQELHR